MKTGNTKLSPKKCAWASPDKQNEVHFLNFSIRQIIHCNSSLPARRRHFFPGEGMRYSQKNWMGVCGPLPKTLTLFMTKICNFSFPIYDLIKHSILYVYRRCSRHGCSKYNLWRDFVDGLIDNDETTRVQKPPYFWPKWPKSIPYLWPERLKTIPFGAAHT